MRIDGDEDVAFSLAVECQGSFGAVALVTKALEQERSAPESLSAWRRGDRLLLVVELQVAQQRIAKCLSYIKTLPGVYHASIIGRSRASDYHGANLVSEAVLR